MDLNFFEPFLKDIKKKEKKPSGGLGGLVIILLILLILAVAGLTTYNMMSISNIQKIIEEYEVELNDPSKLEQLKIVEENIQKLDTIKKERMLLMSVDLGARSIDSVTRHLIDLIAANVTENLYLTQIDVSLKEISLSGKSLTRLEVAQFEYNLRQTGLFDAIYVESINQLGENVGDTHYEFSMRFKANSKVYGLEAYDIILQEGGN